MNGASAPASGSTPVIILFGLLAYNALAAIEPSIVAVMHMVGEAHLIAGRNPVSFCNVLFISQLVSLITFLALFQQDLSKENFRTIGKKKWLSLFAYVALGSVVIQMMYFYSLEYTSVANVVLISSIQIPLAAIANVLLFREALVRRQIGGHILIFTGLLVPFLFSAQAKVGDDASWGNLLAFFAMLCGVANGIFAKYLSDIPLGIIGVVASASASVFFFSFASLYFGLVHFQDLLVPYVWELVVLYAILIVVTRHIVRQVSFRRASNQAINTLSASYPALAVLAAFAIVRQVPTTEQIFGIGCIIAGILLAITDRKSSASFLEKQTQIERVSVRVNA